MTSLAASPETNDVAAVARGEEFRVRSTHALPTGVDRELSRLSPLRATASVLFDFGIIAGLACIAVSWPRVWVVLPAIGLMGAVQHGLAILSHQAAHYRLYETRWVNDLVGKLCAVPLGLSLITYRVLHRTHHNHLYTPIDPDLALIADYPRGRAYLLGKLLKDLSGLTLWKAYGYFFGKPVTKKGSASSLRIDDDTSPALKKKAKRDQVLVVVIQLCALGLSIGFGFWRWYLLLWLLPLVTVLQALLRLRAVLEHGAVDDVTDVRRAARTTHASFLTRFVLYPHNMNFHIEHHLYPSVPHYNLPECHRVLVEAGALDGAEVQSTVSRSFRKIFAPAA